jgi:hypothetical protein
MRGISGSISCGTTRGVNRAAGANSGQVSWVTHGAMTGRSVKQKFDLAMLSSGNPFIERVERSAPREEDELWTYVTRVTAGGVP